MLTSSLCLVWDENYWLCFIWQMVPRRHPLRQITLKGIFGHPQKTLQQSSGSSQHLEESSFPRVSDFISLPLSFISAHWEVGGSHFQTDNRSLPSPWEMFQEFLRIYCCKQQTNATWKGKSLFQITVCSPSWMDIKIGTQGGHRRQKLIQKRWRNAAY